jgi:hypothetical protein
LSTAFVGDSSPRPRFGGVGGISALQWLVGLRPPALYLQRRDTPTPLSNLERGELLSLSILSRLILGDENK